MHTFTQATSTRLRFMLNIAIIAALWLWSDMAFAGGTAMPWDGPLNTLLKTLSGNTAKGLVLVAIAVSGIGFALGESGGFMRKMMSIVMGASVAIGSVTIGTEILGLQGAVI